MMMRILILVAFFLALPLIPQAAEIPEDSSSGVILAYHRIGENAHPETNLRQMQFEEQIEELSDSAYNIMPLKELIEALKNNRTLPPRTIAITFEGAYKSSFENAMPLLLQKNIPFTVFFASDLVDIDSPQYMNWKDIQSLAKSDHVDFGLLPAAYRRLSEEEDVEILSQLNKARTKYREYLSHDPQFFSYAFGEYDAAYKSLIQDQEFTAAFGLQSGAAYDGSDFLALPRFSITESYGNLEHFQMIARSRPLPVSDSEPAVSYLAANTPSIGFTLSESLRNDIDKLSCFVSGDAGAGKEIINNTRVEIRLSDPLQNERTRVNCTMPGPLDETTEKPQWRWHGMLLVFRSKDEISPQRDVLP